MSTRVPGTLRRRTFLVSATLVAALGLGQLAPIVAAADPPGRAPGRPPGPDAAGSARVAPARDCRHGACRPDDPSEPSEPSGALPTSSDPATAAAGAGATPSTAASSPDLRVTKTSDAPPALRQGESFTYTITVTNAGDADATDVKVLDELPAGDDLTVAVSPFPTFAGQHCVIASSLPPGGVAHSTVSCGPATLAAGASETVTIRVVVTGTGCGAITNTVEVRATNEPAELAADDRDEVTDEIDCAPRVRLVIRGPRLAHVGDAVRYRFEVRNTGRTDLSVVTISAPACDGPVARIGDTGGGTALDPGERWTFACRRTISGGDGDPVLDRASVEATHGGDTVSDGDTHRIDVLHPGIALRATASLDSGSPGTQIVVTYRLTNTGDTLLRGVALEDATTGHVTRAGTLDAGSSIEVSSTVTLGQAPLTADASASGHDALLAVVRAEDTVTIGVVAGAGGTGGGGTPFTGSDTMALAIVSLGIGGAGVSLLVATRRRRRSPSAG